MPIRRPMDKIENFGVRCPSCAEVGKDKRGQNMHVGTIGTKVTVFCYAGCTTKMIKEAAKRQAEANPVWQVIAECPESERLRLVFMAYPECFRIPTLDNIFTKRELRKARSVRSS